MKLDRGTTAVGLQIIAAINIEEKERGKWVVGAAKRAALRAGTMPHERNVKINIVEERFGIFFVEALPPSVEPLLLKMNRCMVCRLRLEGLETFMSGGLAFCSSECRSSDAAGPAKVELSDEAPKSCKNVVLSDEALKSGTIVLQKHGSNSLCFVLNLLSFIF